MPRRHETPIEETASSASATSCPERNAIKTICATAMAAIAAVCVASSVKAESSTVEGIIITSDNGSIVEKEILDHNPQNGVHGRWLKVKVAKGSANVCSKKGGCIQMTERRQRHTIDLEDLSELEK